MQTGKKQFMPHVLENRTRHTQLMQQEILIRPRKNTLAKRATERANAALEYSS